MKFKSAAIILILVIVGLFGYAIKVTFDIKEAIAAKEEALELAQKAQESVIESEKETQRKLDSIIRESVTDLWGQAKSINTLAAYSNYAKENPNDSIHGDDLKNAVDNLLSKTGYTQYQETTGNKLYTKVTNLNLEGDFVKFTSDKAVRDGAIGIDGCGSSDPRKIDVLVHGKTVRIKRLCEAPGSQSIWAEIEYSK